MLLEFIQYFDAGKHAMELTLVQAVPGVFSTAFGMITSGNVNQSIAGLLTLVGITLLIWRGLWKIIAQVFWRQVAEV